MNEAMVPLAEADKETLARRARSMRNWSIVSGLFFAGSAGVSWRLVPDLFGPAAIVAWIFILFYPAITLAAMVASLRAIGRAKRDLARGEAVECSGIIEARGAEADGNQGKLLVDGVWVRASPEVYAQALTGMTYRRRRGPESGTPLGDAAVDATEA
jgi:transposase